MGPVPGPSETATSRLLGRTQPSRSPLCDAAGGAGQAVRSSGEELRGERTLQVAQQQAVWPRFPGVQGLRSTALSSVVPASHSCLTFVLQISKRSTGTHPAHLLQLSRHPRRLSQRFSVWSRTLPARDPPPGSICPLLSWYAATDISCPDVTLPLKHCVQPEPHAKDETGLSHSACSRITTLQPPSGPPFFLPKMDQAFRLDSVFWLLRERRFDALWASFRV